MEFSAGADEQLNRLTQALGVKKSEVVRNALSLYDYIVKILQSQPDLALGILNEAMANRIEKVILVPGVYRTPAKDRAKDLVGVP
jgi:hypothetical protein